MSNEIQGKIVVITGASSGLGEATARLLSAPGASVVLGARRVDRIQSLAEELTVSGGKALAVATDVTHCNQVKALAEVRAHPQCFVGSWSQGSRRSGLFIARPSTRCGRFPKDCAWR